MKKSVMAALLTGSLLGGGAIGTAFLGTNAATAQSSSSDSSSSSSSSSDAPPAPPGVPGDHHGPHGRGGPHGPASLSAAASTIGVTEDELRAALESGQSIADVATAHGVDPQTVIDAMVADAKTHLADEVTSGRLTQEQADQISADLEQRITDLANHAGGPGGPGCPNMGSDGSSGSDSSSSSSAPSSQGTSLDT